MRNIILVVALIMCLAVSSERAVAATETVTGEVISLSCYFQNPTNIGAVGAVCARATVRYEGNPVGLLATDGRVYQLAGGVVASNNAKLVPFLGKTVSITGEVTKARGNMMMMTANDVTAK